MDYIEKSFQKSDFEKEFVGKTDPKTEKLVHLPSFVIKWFIKKNLESMRQPLAGHAPLLPSCEHEIEVKQDEIPGKPNPVNINIFTRKGYEAEGKRPLFLYIHGGGFIGGHSARFEPLIRLAVDRLGVISASVDYNLSPEAKWPQAINDCDTALRHLIATYPIDESNIFIAGDSAGGNLTATVTLKLIRDGGPIPKGQILLYPTLDLYYLDSESFMQEGYLFSGMRKLMKVARRLYLPNKKSQEDVLVSPILSKFTSAQPDALSLIAENDGLRSEGVAYAKMLGEAGGYSRCILYKDTYHAFIEHMGRSETSDDSAEEIISFMKERIA